MNKYSDGIETRSNRPQEANDMKRIMVKYKGLIVGINPALTFMRTANKDFELTPEGEYQLFPIRLLVCFNRSYNYKLKIWESFFNPKSVARACAGQYFFEHLWGAVPESVDLNGEAGLNLKELLAKCERNTSLGIKNIINSCILKTSENALLPIEFNKTHYQQKCKTKTISKVEIEGLGPLYPRIHKATGLPFKGVNLSSGDGEIIYHLDKPSIKLLKQVVIK